TINGLEGQPIDEFAIQTARKWQLGQKGKDNGILIVVSKLDKQSRIEVGYGLEGIIPDGFVGRLQRNVLAPNFESGSYYQGLSSTLDKLAQQISKDFTTQPKTQP
ncbi:TPM domain-containing protein, partial [Dolichospermum sp. ST_sed4]|nr:TPM domain-containing protein [Dolichospermum sp. ST_sed4]